jgi:flagellar biogenesis protein FliO
MDKTQPLAPRWSLGPLLSALWTRARGAFASVNVGRRQRHLRLCESLSLGEKRLIAVVQFDNQRFLVAATPQTISLLQSLGTAPPEEEPNASAS